MAPKPASIPQEEWERHKQTITRLYRTSTLKSVVSEMQREHGFQATPWQFEKQLKLWNIRKNTTRKEWENFFDPSQTPQNSIVQPSVTPAGHSKSMASIQRSQRYLRHLRKQRRMQVDLSLHPMIPSDPDSIQQMWDDGLITNLETGLARLGVMSARSVDTTRETDSIHSLSYVPAASEPDQMDFLGPGMNWLDNYDQDMSTPRMAPSPRYESSLAIDPAFMQRQIITREIPSSTNNPIHFCRVQVSWGSHLLKFEKALLLKGVNFNPYKDAVSNKATSSTTCSDGSALELFTKLITGKSKRGPPVRASVHQQAFSRLISLLPNQGTALNSNHQASQAQLIQALLFSLLNGFAGLEPFRGEIILELLGHLGASSSSFLNFLKEGLLHTTKVLLDTMIIAAINAKDGYIVEQLLESPRVNVNDIVINMSDKSFTLVERAAICGDLKILRLLLKAGADVNATHCNEIHDGGALMMLLRAQIHGHANTQRPVPMHTLFTIMKILRAAGAKVWPKHVEIASQICGSPVANYIALTVTAVEHELFFKGRNMEGLKVLVESLGEHEALLAIQNLMEICKKSKCCTCRFARGQWSFQQLANLAAGRGYVDLLRFLSDFVRLSPYTLCAAIKSGSTLAIDLVLSQNPNLDPKGSASVDAEGVATPLSSAVRARNIDLIDYLHKAGTLRRLDEGFRFEALIIAAAEWGDSGYLSMLLVRVDDWLNHDGVPIEAAISAARNGQTSIARSLLQYTLYPPRLGHGRYEEGSILSFAIQHRDVEWVNDILNSHVETPLSIHLAAASEWGDYSVISSLLHHGFEATKDDGCGLDQAWKSLSIRCMMDHNIEMFHSILNSSLSPHGPLTECFIQAARTGNYDMVNYLLDIGESPFKTGILAAIVQHHPNMLDLVTDKQRKRHYVSQCVGAQLIQDAMTVTGNDPAAQSSALKTILGTGAVNLVALEEIEMEPFSRDLTPLGLAIVRLSAEVDDSLWMVEALLSAGADPNSIASGRLQSRWSDPKLTGLLQGIGTGRIDLVQALLEGGGNINQEPQLSILMTPLQWAARKGDMGMVRFLLQRGADVNGRPAARVGGTALQYACRAGNCNIAAILLEHGAELGARPSQIHGLWPLEAAAEHGRLEMIQLLWDAKEQTIGEVEGFQRRQCLKAMAFAHQGGYMACRDLVSELSGIPIEAIDSERVGARWLAFVTLDREAFEREWPSAAQEIWAKSRGAGILGGRRQQIWWSSLATRHGNGYSSSEDDDCSSDDDDFCSEDEDCFSDDHESSSDVDEYGGSSD